jgi:CDP-diacylglycerol--serine O-phosphatidyltransferase
MVSELPTFSFKKLKVPQDYVLFVLVAAGLFVAGLAGAPWRTLIVVALLYLATLPFAYRSFTRLRREAERLHDAGEDDDSGDQEGGPDSPPDEPDAVADESSKSPHLRQV